MKAILSDVHGNLEGLQAVLADAADHGAREIYCLGDLVGYGSNPRECVDIAMQWSVVLLGNFDYALLQDPPSLSPSAIQATLSLIRSRAELNIPIPNREQVRRRWAFLAGMVSQYHEGDFLFVHGSPRNPLYEYVFPEDIYNQRKMERNFALVERYCVQAHTHVPGIFTEQPASKGDPYRFQSPEEIDYIYRLDGRKTFCNVGSVGQQRDGDRRACYVLLNGDTIRFRRVEYDVDAASGGL
jgi:diadenosine tetraphosphatase ApaH/serine/threonine PP2A family protein phosphatase